MDNKIYQQILTISSMSLFVLGGGLVIANITLWSVFCLITACMLWVELRFNIVNEEIKEYLEKSNNKINNKKLNKKNRK